MNNENANANAHYKRMTEAPIPGLIISLGIPTTISMLVTNIYNLADTYFVSQIGLSASGAVGIVFGFMAVLQAIGFLFGQGAGSNIAGCLGAKDHKSASIYATTSFVLAFVLSVIIGIFCYIFIEPFLRLLGSTETILPYAKTYVIYIIISGPFTVCGFVMNNILRFEGRANMAMAGLVSGALLNIIGDPILIFKFNLGIAGAGLSTCLSQIISFFLLLYFFVSGKTMCKLSPKNFKPKFNTVWRILTIGFPSLARQGLQSVSTMLLNNCAAFYGDASVAAMSIVSRLTFFVFAVGLGIGQGFQPVCGFNYGAKIYSRVKEAFKFTLFLGEAFLGAVAVVGFIIAPYAIGWFRKDPEVLEIGVLAFRLQCIGLFFQPLAVMCNMTFQSCQKPVLATVSSLMKSGLFFIPVLLIGTKLFGITGIQASQPIADLLTFIAVLPMIIHFFATMPKDSKPKN
ncbi:MAG: MATE family efflux transporter [Eubacterium sp.]|nr:MATE family efflux transporter [Eubacterium sp.]